MNTARLAGKVSINRRFKLAPHSPTKPGSNLQSVTQVIRNSAKKVILISGIALFSSICAQAAPSYQYNAANQLAKVTLENGTVIENFYDGIGNLVRQQINGESRDILLDESSEYPSVIGIITSTGAADKVAYGPDGATAERHGNDSTQYLLKDQLGTIKGTANESGDIDGRLSLSAYGVPRSSTGQTSVVGYTGEYVDESGLVYLRARHYNPALARFVQKDSFEGLKDEPQSQNNYSYVHNNPLTLADPSGHCAGACIGGIIVAGIGAAMMLWDNQKQKKRKQAYQAWKKQQIASGRWDDGNDPTRYTPDAEGAPLDDVVHGLAMEALAPFAAKVSKAIPTPAFVNNAANAVGKKLTNTVKNFFAEQCLNYLPIPRRRRAMGALEGPDVDGFNSIAELLARAEPGTGFSIVYYKAPGSTRGNLSLIANGGGRFNGGSLNFTPLPRNGTHIVGRNFMRSRFINPQTGTDGLRGGSLIVDINPATGRKELIAGTNSGGIGGIGGIGSFDRGPVMSKGNRGDFVDYFKDLHHYSGGMPVNGSHLTFGQSTDIRINRF